MSESDKSGDQPVENPTYMDPIRSYFTQTDILHMRPRGIELGTYEGVKANAQRTYVRVKEGTMPPGDPWPEAWIETFYNWIKNDCPRGSTAPKPLAAFQKATAARVRENITEVVKDTGKLNRLKKAFQVLMQRSPDDPQSYFRLAGDHWLPGGGPGVYWCRHHENAYNPWHRTYLQRFEDALRSVEGCEDVTLPYWDITDSEVPSVLFEEPFRSYILPQQLESVSGMVYPKGYDTFVGMGRPGDDPGRNDAATIIDNINNKYGIPGNIADALGHSWWERFNGWDCSVPHNSPTSCRTQDGIIRAHDAGHNSCGATMANQDIAAFDPIFWFFHCNWDRLWWQWQQHHDATDLKGFMTTLQGPPDWLIDPVLNTLDPFGMTADKTIDLTATFDVAYAHPPTAAAAAVTPMFASVNARDGFSVRKAARLSTRVKGINRLKIPGSFDVVLKSGDRVIGRQAFFQSTSSQACSTCQKTGVVNFDFVHDHADLAGGDITTSIELVVAQPDGYKGEMPHRAVGDPTINVRLLLDR